MRNLDTVGKSAAMATEEPTFDSGKRQKQTLGARPKTARLFSCLQATCHGSERLPRHSARLGATRGRGKPGPREAARPDMSGEPVVLHLATGFWFGNFQTLVSACRSSSTVGKRVRGSHEAIQSPLNEARLCLPSRQKPSGLPISTTVRFPRLHRPQTGDAAGRRFEGLAAASHARGICKSQGTGAALYRAGGLSRPQPASSWPRAGILVANRFLAFEKTPEGRPRKTAAVRPPRATRQNQVNNSQDLAKSQVVREQTCMRDGPVAEILCALESGESVRSLSCRL